MRVRHLLYSILIVGCFAVSALCQTASVVAWNIEGFEPIPSLRAKNIARAIHNLSPDIIALEEVNPDSILSDIVADLSSQGDSYTAQSLPQTATQNIAFLFKSNVTLSNIRLIPGSDAGNSFLRKALAADVKIGQSDFVLIAVHMKAGRPTSGSNNPQPTRTTQARAIAKFIRQATNGTEKDVLVIGDYNMVPSQDHPNFLAMSPGTGSHEFLRYVSSEALSTQVSHIDRCATTTGQFRAELLDGFAISKSFTREYVEGSLRIIKFDDSSVFSASDGTLLNCTMYTGFVSDHLPLIAKFRIDVDDDQ